MRAQQWHLKWKLGEFKEMRVARLSTQKKAKSNHMMCGADLLRGAVTPVPETSFKLTKL